MHELKTINAVLNHKDVDTLFKENVSDLFVEYGDVWAGIKEYYNRHREMPAPEIVKESFPKAFEIIEAPGAVDYYVDSLRASFLKNKGQNIFSVADGLFEQAPAEEVIAAAIAKLQDLRKYSVTATEHNIMDIDAAEDHYAEVRRLVAERGGVPGITSGVATIDSAYPTGMMGGDLIICLGFTGRKKSFFTTLLACNAYNDGKKPMIVSLEMSASKVRDRVYTILGSGLFQNSALALGDVSEDNFNQFRTTYQNRQEFIVVNGDGRVQVSPNVIQTKIDQHKPDILILDYAQLMSDNEGTLDMTRRMLNLSVELKALAVANDIPVILISSATADGKVGQDPPTIEQVAWSRQLAFDADLAFAVHGIDDSDLIKVVCRKNRNGAQFNVVLDWDIDRGKWQETFVREAA